MSRKQPYKKGTILVPSGSCDHLHIVCNDPVLYPRLGVDSVLLVNVTSVKPSLPYDTSCVLEVGDHPFIKQKSYIYYKKADIFGANTLQHAVDNGDYHQREDMQDSTFQRVLRGFEITDEASYKVTKFYEKYCK